MRSDNYRHLFQAANMMGPNSLRLLDALLEAYPLQLPADARVLDLGCGTGVTSLFTAQETGATVYAVDLWIAEADNRARFAGWGMSDRILPINADANEMPFAPDTFDAMVSVDAYHYFGIKAGFFAQKILPLIQPGGTVLIAVPGRREALGEHGDELLAPWLGDEACMFRSAEEWRHIIGSDPAIAEIRTWELPLFDLPWQEWFDTQHKYALGDKQFYETIIRPYTTFVGIMVRKAQ